MTVHCPTSRSLLIVQDKNSPLSYRRTCKPSAHGHTPLCNQTTFAKFGDQTCFVPHGVPIYTTPLRPILGEQGTRHHKDQKNYFKRMRSRHSYSLPCRSKRPKRHEHLIYQAVMCDQESRYYKTTGQDGDERKPLWTFRLSCPTFIRNWLYPGAPRAPILENHPKPCHLSQPVGCSFDP